MSDHGSQLRSTVGVDFTEGRKLKKNFQVQERPVTTTLLT